MRTASQRRTLVVDDHEDSRDLLRDLLELDGHEVECTGDGRHAIELLLRGRFDVAILDIGLPHVDGFQIAALVREKLGPQAPLLIGLTGYATPEFRAKAMLLGFDAYLLKPVEREELLAALGPGASA